MTPRDTVGSNSNMMKHGTIRIVGRANKTAETATTRVVDTTSKSSNPDHRKLSPFYAHAEGFAVPGAPGTRSLSVEGLWQGLKIVEGATGPDVRRFGIIDGKGLKVGRTKKVLGHWNGDDKPLLGYVDARKTIFIPAYREKLERFVTTDVQEFVDWLRGHPERTLILKDFFINADVEDTSRPLSHASLLADFIREKLDAVADVG